jgi:hypothetical protein
MVRDPAAVGAVAASLLGLIGFVRARWRTVSSRSSRRGLVHLAETYVIGLEDVALERERRSTIVAVLAALPLGGVVTYQHSNGAKLTIRTLSTTSSARPQGAQLSERRDHAGP